ncbi:MAG: hypothetical protein LAP13_27225, partial [Acidobacteriia bacterium]|nr:hypothetical protein [Terriglobia bacterium]
MTGFAPVSRLSAGARRNLSRAAQIRRIVLLAILLALTMLVCPRRVGAAAPQSAPPAQATPPAKPSPEQEEGQALAEAVRSSLGNPQALIKNLEDFLTQ